MTNKKTILVIDDEKDFTLIIGEALEQRGYHVIQANSGAEALEILAKTAVDMITLDLNMPGIDGIEVAKAANKLYPSLKIIVISAFGGEYDDELKQIRYDSHIPKPINITELLIKIPELLRGTGI